MKDKIFSTNGILQEAADGSIIAIYSNTIIYYYFVMFIILGNYYWGAPNNIFQYIFQVEVHYWSGNESSIREMLATATKLESFNSYKLRSNQHLDFASPELTSIDLHRSDTLSSVSIWAPKLIHLGLQACYNLQNIEFLDSHPLSSKLPTSFACRAPLVVNTANALLSFRAKRALHDHPRAVPAAQRHPGLATESTFAQMHDMADGDDYDWYHNSEWPGDIEDFYGEEDDLGSVGEDFVGDDDDEMEEFDDGVDFE